jgi:hypothetical protein
MPNYIVDVNRFKLAGPPKWFLRALWEFDPSLVIVPSRQDCVYRLAQRRKLSLPDHIVNDSLFKESDTKMLASYGLIPVTSILSTATWSPILIEELRRRASWRQFKSAEDAANAVEAQEAAEELKKQEALDEMLHGVSKDAWQMYRKKIGLQTHGFTLKTDSDKKASSTAPSIRVTQKSAPGVSVQTLFKS